MRGIRSPGPAQPRTRQAAGARAQARARPGQGARPLAGLGLSGEAKQHLLAQVLGAIALYALVVNFIVGAISALIFLLASVTVFVLGPRQALAGFVRVAPLFALPLMALVSTAWSEAPGTTARAALQVLATAAAATVLGVRCSEKTVVLALFLGLLTVCSTAIPEAREGLQTGLPILGSFGSKNALGIHSQFLEIFALAVAFDRTRGWAMRLFALGALALSLVLVFLARSGGAASLAGITLVLFPVLLLFGRLPIWARISGLVSALVLAIVGLILAPQISALVAWFRTDVLGKDATLTGRTELWEIADKLVSERPLLGHGYFAFWRLGNPEAEAIWRNFGVGRGGGFNFHNEIVEFSVGLGQVGVGLLIVLCLIVAGLVAIRHILHPSFQSAVAVTALVSIYARAFVETGLIAPFSIVLAYWMIMASRAVAVLRTGAVPGATPPLAAGHEIQRGSPAWPARSPLPATGPRGQVLTGRD
ncbi:MAG TPA: O-antigen ligase family protein [Novosphingobium sp.]